MQMTYRTDNTFMLTTIQSTKPNTCTQSHGAADAVAAGGYNVSTSLQSPIVVATVE